MTSASAQRAELLQGLVEAIARMAPDRTILVAIDGVDGAGKTVLADELARQLSAYRPVVRASVDGFHRPKAQRYRRGRDSPEGYYRDAYNYDQLKDVLLDPLRQRGSERFRRSVFDHEHDTPTDAPLESAAPGSALLLDGIFLHRPELRDYWDFSIYLEVGFGTSVARCARRDGTSPDPGAAENRRYVDGQRLYVAEASPREHASMVIDNTNLDAPHIVRHGPHHRIDPIQLA